MVNKTNTKKNILQTQRKNIYVPNTRNSYRGIIKLERDIVKSNNLGNILNSSDDNVSSTISLIKHHYTDKSVEMKALNK